MNMGRADQSALNASIAKIKRVVKRSSDILINEENSTPIVLFETSLFKAGSGGANFVVMEGMLII